MKKISIAIVGATGIVGTKFLEVLAEQKISFSKLYLFASSKSAGKTIIFNKKRIKIEELCEKNIKNKKIDYAFFSAGGKVSKAFAPIFNQIGAVVIDNSSCYRMEKNVPLVVPEVNGNDALKNAGIISNPNCSTIQCMLPLFVINSLSKILRVNFVTFQAVSGSGMKGITDLALTKNGEQPQFYPYAIHNNCLPHIGSFLENGFSEEELKMVNETKKILNLPNLEVSATCVRVPVENCHSICISVTCENEINLDFLKEKMKNFNGITLLDDVSNNTYPLCSIANNSDSVFVGRIRVDLFNKKTIHMFCVSDNLRKGAATNGVQILKLLTEQKNNSN